MTLPGLIHLGAFSQNLQHDLVLLVELDHLIAYDILRFSSG